MDQPSQQPSRLERVLGKLQQQIANDAANYRTQIALLEVELEEVRVELETLRADSDTEDEQLTE